MNPAEVALAELDVPLDEAAVAPPAAPAACPTRRRVGNPTNEAPASLPEAAAAALKRRREHQPAAAPPPPRPPPPPPPRITDGAPGIVRTTDGRAARIVEKLNRLGYFLVDVFDEEGNFYERVKRPKSFFKPGQLHLLRPLGAAAAAAPDPEASPAQLRCSKRVRGAPAHRQPHERSTG